MIIIYKEKLYKCVEFLKSKTSITPHIAIVLGSGLGALADKINKENTVSYSEIPGMPVSGVSGHKGRFVFGHIGGVPVVIMQGRVHYYEGYSMQDVVLPIRIMGMLGAKTLLLTNAAGGINQDFSSGDFMVIKGQIASFVPSPLIGDNIDPLGTRFPDMSNIYDKRIQDILAEASVKAGEKAQRGVYLQASGPQYETPEEIKMFSVFGADAVGMSTACEAIAARHMGLSVGGISLITNMAAGISKTLLSHEEVKSISDMKTRVFEKIIINAVLKIGAIND